MAAMQASVDDSRISSAHVFISPSLRLLNVRKRTLLAGIGAKVLQTLLGVDAIGGYFLRLISRTEALRSVVRQAYAVHDAIDDDLIDALQKPALTEGALGVFQQFISYDQGPIPEDLLPQLEVSALILWGAEDEFEPIRLGRKLANYDCVDDFVELPEVGHCAHDESPEIVNKYILDFIEKVSSRKLAST